MWKFRPLPLLNKTTCRLDPLDETLRTPPKRAILPPPDPHPPDPPKKGVLLYYINP